MPSAKPFSIFWAALPALFMCLSLLPASVGLAARSARPAWVSDMHAYHCYRAYIVARGSGGSGREAETDALRGLAGVFGLNVRAVETVTALSRQTAIDGAVTWTQDTEFRRILETSVERENLIGAEVRERWDDGRGTHYVLAVIPRATAVVLYSGRIAANRDVVANLVGMSDAERNTITGFARYRSAAAFADMNVTYGEILVSLRAPWSEPLLGGEYFRRRAQAVARQIPVAINVRGVNQAAAGRIRSAFADVSFSYGQMLVVLGAPWGEPLRTGAYFLERSREILTEIQIGINVNSDRGQRIGGAFAQAVSGLGFRTAGTNPRFVLNVIVNTWRDEHLVQGAEFTWIEIGANLIDRNTGPFCSPTVSHSGASRTLPSPPPKTWP